MTKTFYKILKGYTTQARWYAENLETPSGEWDQVGWTKLGNHLIKPVFKMTNGIPIVILDGKTHLHAVAIEVPAGCIFKTEDEAYAAQGGW